MASETLVNTSGLSYFGKEEEREKGSIDWDSVLNGVAQ
jgi:hypothetical protein